MYCDVDVFEADGTCAIEPLLHPRVMFARAKPTDIAKAASLVIRECVNGRPSSGGIAEGFGKPSQTSLTLIGCLCLVGSIND